jgi:peptidoglycan/xylan/chitin deacetylase (PgdA/CDA1 family)
MNPISIAIKGKGPFHFLHRAASIVTRYGFTTRRLDRVLAQFAEILRRFGCSATFPITGVALVRSLRVIAKYQEQGIEFAIHGYRHVDYSQLFAGQQAAEIALAKRIFIKAGIHPQGFRCPYLRWNSDILAALKQHEISYDSSSTLAWDIIDGDEPAAYRRVLNFYGAKSASDYPALPNLQDNLVRFPYSLPDDEALVERLGLDTPSQMSKLWLTILRRTYALGELFVLGLHPERLPLCQSALEAVLAEVRQFTPAVWVARLDEINVWWRERATAQVTMTDMPGGRLRLSINCPARATVLTRNVGVDIATMPWADNYRQLESRNFIVAAPPRPFIGLSPTASPKIAVFLRQQGYIVETTRERQAYSYYFDQADFTPEKERPLLDHIENTGYPLVRLGRWPQGARSALAVTGDIDALTLWDYGLRLLGK